MTRLAPIGQNSWPTNSASTESSQGFVFDSGLVDVTDQNMPIWKGSEATPQAGPHSVVPIDNWMHCNMGLSCLSDGMIMVASRDEHDIANLI
jgi:hypothetical protein